MGAEGGEEGEPKAHCGVGGGPSNDYEEGWNL